MSVKGKISVLALTMMLILGMNPSQAQAAPLYLGQTTWSILITEDTIDPFMVGTTLTLTGGITKVGGSYYLFQGTTMYGSTRLVLSGGGILVNSQLILSVTESGESPEGDKSNGVMHFTLNQSNLSGTMTDVQKGRVGTGFGQAYLAGTVTRTGPFIPLNLPPIGALMLLLQ
jgi:hypothetical protein